MRFPVPFAILALLPVAVHAQPATTVEVALSSFKFMPDTIRLHHGQHYVLRLTNTGSGGHNFAAEKFFAAARLSAGAPVSKGVVDVDGGETVTVDLTAPAAGSYPVHCTHFLHTGFGMKGVIVVD